MSNPLESAVDESDETDEVVELAHVEVEREVVRGFVKGLDLDDLKSGAWFARLLSFSLDTYTTKVDWRYFQEKYRGVPADAIVEQRIKMASRYAAIEGGLSASAYTGAFVATVGTAGGASPLAVPAAMTTAMVDLAYISQLQLRLAYDIAVLYRIPLDLGDPEDLWKLIRVAFTIKGGELANEGVIKAAPLVMRPLLKKFYSKGVLHATKGLPVVGKYLLQRNVIKIGIPLVGIPLAVVMNKYTTLVAGRHARELFRDEALTVELAVKLCSRTEHPRLMLWVAWAVVRADGQPSDRQSLLLRHLVIEVRERYGVVDDALASVIQLDVDDVWFQIEGETSDLSDIVDMARRVSEVDGKPSKKQREFLTELSKRCRVV